MSILVSKQVGSEIKCGCAVHCRDRFGDPIKIVTSGFTTPCLITGVGTSERLVLIGSPNGGFDLTWDAIFSRWTAVLTTGEIRGYSTEDCTGGFSTVSAEVAVSIFCTSGPLQLLVPAASIDESNAQFDTPYFSAPGALLADGVITILNPEAP